MSPTATLSRLPGDDALRLVMAASGIGMAICDIEGHWKEVNPALCAMLGYEAGALLGHAAREVTHPDDIAPSRELLRRITDEPGLLLEARKRYLRRDGSVLWAQVNIAMLRDAGGEPICILVQIRDIGAQLAHESEMEASAVHRSAELEASNHQLQLFADAVAHDLRAPLRSILSFSERLGQTLGEDIDADAQDYLQRISASARRMSELLAALGRLSRATRAELNPQPVDLSMLADWVHAELLDAEPEREVSVDIQSGLTVQGDERLLKVLLDELLGNAWKFTRGCEAARIEFGGEPREGVLNLYVRDNGTGFDMRYVHKLFEPFQRLHSQDDGGGHGLGLTIAQRVAMRHGGRLQAESRPGHGTTLSIELPAGPS
ncbi:sensor histidine kinase [Marilutibacter aestuarii]|uniref:histidine kinase n=1 Tax=Marilutibacter aestuarii TaxID=1706195 RepID=A0A507ZRB4_9GAMM|nr:ATP-binding protein [Lysobacter aestuarii]TQD39909.1 PAS domain S-box protein [Lysobacter aestuarii]